MKALVTERVWSLKRIGRPVALGGFLSKQRALALLTWADFVLIPSRIESIPVIFSDALKAKCPIIAMPVGDMPRLIKKYQVGVIANAVDAKSYANAIAKATKKCPLTYEKALSWASSDFDLGAIVPEFLRLINLEPGNTMADKQTVFKNLRLHSAPNYFGETYTPKGN